MALSQLRRSALFRVLLTLAWVALIYSMHRLLFWWLNSDALPHAPFLALIGGVRFDLSAIAWLNMPWLLLVMIDPSPAKWFASMQRWVFIAVNSVGFFFNCVDLEYFKFTLKRSTADLFDIATGGSDLMHVMPVFLRDYWYVVLIFIVSIAVSWKGCSFIMRPVVAAEIKPSIAQRAGWRVALIIVVVILSRGGVQLIPLAPLDASNYAPAAYMPLVLNTPFTIMTSIGKPVVEEKHYMSQAEADRLWPVVHKYEPMDISGEPGDYGRHVPPVFGELTKPNVVVVIMESFSAAYSAHLSGRPDGCMPFLDSLMGQGLNFTRAYANGRRSIDGVPAVLASIPKLMDEAFITSNYATTPFTSLANTLAGEGYRTSFFHGGHNGTMGFDSFAKSAGFQDYIGRDQYPDPADDDGVWGIRDRPFFQFFARELNKKQQPFFASIFSLSSHHPYELPPEDAKRFAGGKHRIMPTLRYADDALRRFFATARKMPWFSNTLFVITADHTADLDRDGELSNQAADYWVPILFYSPAISAPRGVTTITQQIDIMPTVLDLVGYPNAFFSFGSSALREDHAPCAVVQNNNLYLAIGEKEMLLFDGAKVVPPIATPDTLSIEAPLKAAIQQFNSHMLHKDLVYAPAK